MARQTRIDWPTNQDEGRTMNTFLQNKLEEFDRFRNELHHTILEPNDEPIKESECVYFGYRIQRGNEIFTVTDWGHIKEFIIQYHKELVDEMCALLSEEEQRCPKCLSKNPGAESFNNGELFMCCNKCGKCFYAVIGAGQWRKRIREKFL